MSMGKLISILHLEDSIADYELVNAFLTESGLNVNIIRTETKEDFLNRLQTEHYDLIISDFSLPAYDGKSALFDLQKIHPDIPFIFVSGNIGEEYAVESLQQGATDYILKNNLKRLPSAVKRALTEAVEKRHLKTIERELKDREKFIQKIMDTTPNIIYVYDIRTDVIVWVNNSIQQALGYSPNNIIQQKDVAKQMLHPEDHAKFIAIDTWHKPSIGGEVVDFTYRIKHFEGNWRWVYSRTTIFSTDENKIPVQILGVADDVTDKKELEARYYRSQRMESIGELAGGIAHDLNNVFGPMLLAIPLLQRQLQDENSKKFLAMIEGGIHRGTNMVKQILLFARGANQETTVFSPKSILQEIESIIKETFPKSIDVRVMMDTKTDMIMGDHTQLHQILLNLCVNARDAMPSGGVLSLQCNNFQLLTSRSAQGRVIKPGSYIQITVEDTGDGIPTEIVGKIFDPFFTTKEIGKGTGIGLSTVQSIVQNHSGFIEVESTVGTGSKFKVYLPSRTVHTQKDIEQPSVIPFGHEELIMIVDDESSMLQIAKEALESSNFKTITARDGAEAIALFTKLSNEIQLVICDMIMPLLDGSKTIPVLKKIKPSIKIIIASGNPTMHIENEMMKEYDAVMLPKPYTVQKLLNTIHSTLSGSQ